jgi:hypothetical protein
LEDSSHVPRRTIWLTDAHDRQLEELAARWGTSFSGAIGRLLNGALVGILELDRAERELPHAG